jgi:hypothetical protein
MRFWHNPVILSFEQSSTEQQTHSPTRKGNPVPLNNIEEIFIYLVKIGKLSRNHYRNTINLLFLIPARGRGSSYLSSPRFFSPTLGFWRNETHVRDMYFHLHTV